MPFVNPTMQQTVNGQPLNPDGSAPPVNMGGGITARSVMSGTPNPTTGPLANFNYSGAGTQDVVRNNPTAILDQVLQQRGIDPYGGLGDVLGSIANGQQLDTLFNILAANSGQFGGTANDQGGWLARFYQGLLGNQQIPNMGQVFGGVFNNGAQQAGSPLYGLLTGGTPSQQAGQLIGAIGDVGRMAMSPLALRAMQASLSRLANIYVGNQGQIGANQTFVDYLQRVAPQLVGALGG